MTAKPQRRLAGRPLLDGRGQGPLELSVGEFGQGPDHLLQVQRTGEIADAERQRRRAPLPPDRGHHVGGRAFRAGQRKRRVEIARRKRGGDFGQTIQQEGQEGRTGPGTGDRAVNFLLMNCFFHTTGRRRSVPPAATIATPRANTR